jgi:uncharacterized protein YecE (DUF72 family)
VPPLFVPRYPSWNANAAKAMRKDKKHYNETTLQFNNRLLAILMNDQTRALEKFNDTFARLAKTKELEYWAKQVKNTPSKVKFAIIAANNPYAGFGPATANIFLRMMGLPTSVWEDMKQTTLE